ncbi:MAG: Rieske (2Fe-2S) protein [Actinomycetota bacterium]|nr:Rieske (2Fe-2S) protein [Actinomycetota bacterium]
MEKISRKTFVRLAAALGVGAASASVAACGGSSSGGSSGSSGGDSGGSNGGGKNGASGGNSKGQAKNQASSGGDSKDQAKSQAPSGGAAVAKESEVAVGSAVKFKDGGKDAVLVHLEDGDFVAYSAVCTHAGCTVAYKNAQLACPCHGSIFDPANGAEVVSGPAQTPLAEIPVEVRNGEVLRA